MIRLLFAAAISAHPLLMSQAQKIAHINRIEAENCRTWGGEMKSDGCHYPDDAAYDAYLKKRGND